MWAPYHSPMLSACCCFELTRWQSWERSPGGHQKSPATPLEYRAPSSRGRARSNMHSSEDRYHREFSFVGVRVPWWQSLKCMQSENTGKTQTWRLWLARCFMRETSCQLVSKPDFHTRSTTFLMQNPTQMWSLTMFSSITSTETTRFSRFALGNCGHVHKLNPANLTNITWPSDARVDRRSSRAQ